MDFGIELPILRGRAWVRRGVIPFDAILPARYWKSGGRGGGPDDALLGAHAMEGIDPEFAREAAAGGIAFVVAGRNFGAGGKSIEHPVLALKAAGIRAVIADSCSRYLYRNAIDHGLPVLLSPGIAMCVSSGDELEVDVTQAVIRVVATGRRLTAAPIPLPLLRILECGGYVPYVRRSLEDRAATRSS